MITPTARMTDVTCCSYSARNAQKSSIAVARKSVSKYWQCRTNNKKKFAAESIKDARYLRKADQEIFFSNLVRIDGKNCNQRDSTFRSLYASYLLLWIKQLHHQSGLLL